MPNNLKNWSFHDVVKFLHQHYFKALRNKGGSHHYFQGLVDGRIKLIEVQYHPKESIKIKTLKHGIIVKSGIPEKVWKKWGNSSTARLSKKIQYQGAKDFD